MKSMKIMVIDDDTVLADVLSMMIKQLGHDVEAYTDPLEAAKVLKTKVDYDAILVDMRMPQLSGSDLIKSVKWFCDRKDPKTHIIPMTGGGDGGFEMVEELVKDKITKHYIYKPFSIKDLACLLDKLNVNEDSK